MYLSINGFMDLYILYLYDGGKEYVRITRSINYFSSVKLSYNREKVIEVLPSCKQHKFCWYNGEPEEYDAMLKGSKIEVVDGFGLFVEIVFDNKMRLCFNDGVNVRASYILR